jgi:hypothetical protein
LIQTFKVFFSVANALRQYRQPNLSAALSTNLEFRIPTVDNNLVQQFGNIFQLAQSEWKFQLEAWLHGGALGGGNSETTVVVRDSGWLQLIPSTCGSVITYINQKDASSVVRLRPDVTQYLNGAIFLKVEQKASQEELLIARGELVAKLNRDAYLVFPKDNRSIIGFASAGGLIDMVEISVAGAGTFNAHLLRSFNLTAIEGRVAFLETLMKFLRFVVTIDGPNQSFHLIPGSRRQTPNGHHVTWIREGLLKEYGRLQSPQQMEMIQAVYEANLAHVEHGVVENRESKVALITRVGRQLIDCIVDQTVTKEVALQHITLGIRELHSINLAHCDICVSNCYVDMSGPTPVVFLDDLEYIRPIGASPPPSPPHNSRLPDGFALPLTARELDLLQLRSLEIEIMRI